MKRQTALAIGLAVLNAGLAVACLLLLPETVTTQLSVGGNATTMPKGLAVLIPALLGIGGAAVCLLQRKKDTVQKRPLILSAVGAAVFALMLVIN